MSVIRKSGRHRKPRRSRATQLLRGGFLSGVLGTVAVSAPAGASESAGTPPEPPAETSGELPALNGVLTAGASEAAEATERYADRAVVAGAHARAAHDAEQAAAEYRAEQERAAEEAAARAAEEEAARAAEERAAEEAAASRDGERTELLSASEPAGGATDSGADETAAPSGGAHAAVDFARSQLGSAYSLGANGPDAWDCSSLTQAAYGQAGISLPRTSQEQSALGTEVSLDQAQPGDLLYWGGRGSAYHVAIYVGDGRFVGAQNSSTGVVERDLDWDMPTGAIRL